MTTMLLLIVPMLGLGNTPIEMETASPPRKELRVRRMAFETAAPSLEEVAQAFDREGIPFHALTFMWAQFPYKPEVDFRIACGSHELYLQYRVRETYVLAECAPDNDACWPANDSCVEFFVSPGSDDHYLNFEFSCIGYCLVESGRKGTQRERLPLTETARVRRRSTLGAAPFELREGDFSWTLTAAIPLSLITGEETSCMSGTTWKANFYKCGDRLPERAYLAWSPVLVPEPSFHQPQEFGTLVFE